MKERHPHTIKTCKYFLMGKCDFPESVCWFNHTKDTSSPSPQSLLEFRCGFCDKVYRNKSQFMKHRKSDHEDSVPDCRDFKNECCNFSANECWFKHGNSQPHIEI